MNSSPLLYLDIDVSEIINKYVIRHNNIINLHKEFNSKVRNTLLKCFNIKLNNF